MSTDPGPLHITFSEEMARRNEVDRVHKAHRGYALRQIKATRDRMAADLDRDMAAGRLTDQDAIRAAARLASYNDLLTALDTLKGLIK
jgi:hypothetical protein